VATNFFLPGYVPPQIAPFVYPPIRGAFLKNYMSPPLKRRGSKIKELGLKRKISPKPLKIFPQKIYNPKEAFF